MLDPYVPGGKIVYRYTDCYTINGTKVTPSGQLQKKESFTGSFVYQDTLWAVGGMIAPMSSQIISQGGKSSPGPSIPFRVGRHTMTNINTTTSILIGGSHNGALYSADTFYFDHLTSEWTSGPKLNNGRMHHAAGIVTDTVTGEKLLVAVGGSRAYTSTEILIGKDWFEGKTLVFCRPILHHHFEFRT